MRRAPPDPAHFVVFALFLLIPLIATRLLWDQFTTAKWYVLQALAALWLALEGCGGGAWRWPAFLRRWRLAALALLALSLLGAARAGWAWSLTPLAERAAVLALVLCFFRYASRAGHPLRWPARGTAVAALVTNALLSAQILGYEPLHAFSASDGRSALFGNTNMAAQFLGWSFLLLLLARPRPGPGRHLREALLAWTAAHLYFLSSRSVLLGTGLGLLLLLAARRAAPRALLRIGAGAGVLVAVLLSSGSADEYLGGARRFKGLGVQYRVALWRSTLPLIADHPLGVGAFNFSHAFPPYQVAGSLPRDEAVEYRHPHNEPLRVAVEEGWVFAGLAALLSAALLRELARSRRVRRGRGARGAFLLATGAFLAVESLFQFPLAMALGALAFALWLGVALASLEPEPPEAAGGAPRYRAMSLLPCAVLSLAIAAGAARAAWSEYLFVNRQSDLGSQDRACGLDPRNLPACVSAAWLEAEAGRYRESRERLAAVLARSAHYGPAIKLLGEVAISAGDAPAGCFYLWLYDGLFHGASSVHSRLRECPADWLSSFPRQQPVPYHGPFPGRGREAAR